MGRLRAATNAAGDPTLAGTDPIRNGETSRLERERLQNELPTRRAAYRVRSRAQIPIPDEAEQARWVQPVAFAGTLQGRVKSVYANGRRSVAPVECWMRAAVSAMLGFLDEWFGGVCESQRRTYQSPL